MIRKLVIFTIAIVCLLCPQVRANQHSVTNVKETIVKHSIVLGIDPALALSIAKSESGFRHEAKSSYGAVGVFQLMPSTAKRLGINPYYLSDNIKGGLMYYKKLYKMFGTTELALAAYNAGPGTVRKYNKVPPYGETKYFVSRIMTEYNRQKTNPDPAILKVKKEVQNQKIKDSKSDTTKVTTEKQEQVTVELPKQGVI
jgi:soluble lytic murein transglycosylase-like protein